MKYLCSMLLFCPSKFNICPSLCGWGEGVFKMSRGDHNEHKIDKQKMTNKTAMLEIQSFFKITF